jgi:hypothetical protein
VRKHLQFISRLTEDLELPLPPKYDLLGGNFHLKDFITLSTVKPFQSAGVLKKMLHVPSCRVYALKEQLLSSRDGRSSLRDWIAFWQTLSSRSFIKVHQTFWNCPEGCISVLMDYLPGGSLLSVVKFTYSLPDKALQELARTLLLRLQEFNQVC